jgi:hypothetical protein
MSQTLPAIARFVGVMARNREIRSRPANTLSQVDVEGLTEASACGGGIQSRRVLGYRRFNYAI